MDEILTLLKTSRQVGLEADIDFELRQQAFTAVSSLQKLISTLQNAGYPRESQVLADVITLCRDSKDHGGLGLHFDAALSDSEYREVRFLISAWLEALNSADRSKTSRTPLSARPSGRRGMTLTEKTFAMHDVQGRGQVSPGMTISVSVDWVLASDASWGGMERTYKSLNSPGIFRNDRFWLALDHVVDPRINHKPEVAKLIELGEAARDDFKMTDFQGQNYTILHTEFYRQRAEPGMIVIGSDSHTCSSGALGLLSIGLGAADVTMALVTGEIWFKVPEIVEIRFVGEPPIGIGGKDVILYILQQLRRNTVAADRVVEYTGPGLKYLSCDARFAIANMTTEFGGITGIFVPDEVTYDFIEARKNPRNKANSIYFQPDVDAEYSSTHEIDLSTVKPFIAKYPNPDDVVSVTEFEGTELDGCFIGACTTAEEDIILGALVLEQGLKMDMKPVSKGKRKVTPGSRPIVKRLEESGLADVYRAAGFEIGIPGCSYCVGMSADKAGDGEVWLSSQNRNFENRMGRGSVGNLASAATVAASSFEMRATDPTNLIKQIKKDRWTMLRQNEFRAKSPESITYVEPCGEAEQTESPPEAAGLGREPETVSFKPNSAIIAGKVQKLGDMIDTDALAPAEYLIHANSNEAIGQHCLEYTDPEFRERVDQGFNIIVAGKGFGCGSSRMEAVMALLGCGVQCVIAESFAFIFSRNAPSLGLVTITITDQAFYKLATDGVEISVDLEAKELELAGSRFRFSFSAMEKQLMELGGITQAFHKHGKKLFQTMVQPSGAKLFSKSNRKDTILDDNSKSQLAW